MLKKRIISIFIVVAMFISTCYYSVYGYGFTDLVEDIGDGASSFINAVSDSSVGKVVTTILKANPVTGWPTALIQTAAKFHDDVKNMKTNSIGNIDEKDIYDLMLSYADFYTYTETSKSENTHLSYYIEKNGITNEINKDKISRNDNAIYKMEHEFTDEQLAELYKDEAINTTNRRVLLTGLLYNKRYRNTISDYLNKSANDIADGKPRVKDTFKTKFMYNLDRINQYATEYSRANLSINLVGNELSTIKRVWGLKLQASQEGSSSPFSSSFTTRTDLYVSKDDSYNTKMNYDRDHIQLYLAVYGRGAVDEGTLIEWNYFLNNNKHSAYFNKHSDGKGKWMPNSIPNDEWNEDDENAYWEAIENPSSLLYKTINAKEVDNIEFENPNFTMAEENTIKVSNINGKDTTKYAIPMGKQTTTDDNGVDVIIDSGNAFVDNEANKQISDENIKNISNTIYNILLIVGIIIAVLVGSIIGIKFMIGSVEEKAEVKKLLVPYIVGCVVVFGAFTIWKIAVTIIGQI
ncbi:MAG: hypothetical protein IKF97_05435 [Clostridia bacterium]|nr:hypothetical protein [Clostridia bacterium]